VAGDGLLHPVACGPPPHSEVMNIHCRQGKDIGCLTRPLVGRMEYGIRDGLPSRVQQTHFVANVTVEEHRIRSVREV
jgi:hypothetical protein